MSLSSVYPINSLLIRLGKMIVPWEISGVISEGRTLFQPLFLDVVQHDGMSVERSCNHLMVSLRLAAGDIMVEFFRGRRGHLVVIPRWVGPFEDAFPIICDRRPFPVVGEMWGEMLVFGA